MLSLQALVSEQDVEQYASQLVLPPYLSHLRLAPFELKRQSPSSDGREPLVLTYLGEGRLEQFLLESDPHALDILRFVLPGVDVSRIRLPQDDARWHWSSDAGAGPATLRIYFSPTCESLGEDNEPPEAEEAYVSVSRGHVFVGRALVELYVKTWLARLDVHETISQFKFVPGSEGVEFVGPSVGGQLLFDGAVVSEDLIRFAGLGSATRDAAALVESFDDVADGRGFGVFEDGVYLHLP